MQLALRIPTRALAGSSRGKLPAFTQSNEDGMLVHGPRIPLAGASPWYGELTHALFRHPCVAQTILCRLPPSLSPLLPSWPPSWCCWRCAASSRC